MRKTTIALAVALASLATASLANAAPQSETWYVGGKLGWSNFQHTKPANTVIDAYHQGSVKKNDVGGGVFVGYQATPYVAFELGYDMLGQMKYKPNDGVNPDAKYKVNGGQFAVKLSYPVMHDLDVYSRLGAFMWDSKAKGSVGNFDESDNGLAPLAALGIEYSITPDISTRLDYQWVAGVGDKSEVGTRPNNGLLSAGIVYHFGQTSAPVATPAPMVKPKVKEFELNQEVLFDFNKATLKPEASEVLDKLYQDVTNHKVNEKSVIVIGHSDRLGTTKVNQEISDKRAHAVMDYLISKGIPKKAITAHGVGSTESIIGKKCDGLSGATLKSCLSPDRRVVIEVHGTHMQ